LRGERKGKTSRGWRIVVQKVSWSRHNRDLGRPRVEVRKLPTPPGSRNERFKDASDKSGKGEEEGVWGQESLHGDSWYGERIILRAKAMRGGGGQGRGP